ncbi:transcriptional regulator [Shinella zoogloeoides]|uniref:Transcriptional regulator n=2 Tax=Shinella zoogloeoides TaxID=352475 RepID=A0A6N8TIN7_SHIZO|nr:transcriptional regulator [Shinella zoogloeoides]
MARVALGLGVRELAALAKVAPATVSRFEAGEELKERTVEAMQTALEAAGIVFLADDGNGPGIRLRNSLDAAE